MAIKIGNNKTKCVECGCENIITTDKKEVIKCKKCGKVLFEWK